MAGVDFWGKGSLKATASCAKIFTLIVVTLGCCLAAPSNSQTNLDLWQNPCSGQSIRHTRSAADKELKFFINILNVSLVNEFKKLYPKGTRVGMKHVKGNCPKYNRLVQPITNAHTVAEAYKKFHLAMYQLAGFLDTLRDIPIETTAANFDKEKRIRIYNNTKDALRLTICEFHETLKKEFNAEFSPKPPKVKRGCLPKKAQLSQIQMLDMQFVKKLKKVIRNGRKILAQKRRNSKSSRRTKS